MTPSPDDDWLETLSELRLCNRGHTADAIERLLADHARMTEEVRRLGGGCEANADGLHTVIKRGDYTFCGDCGYSLKRVRYTLPSRASRETDPNG